MRLISVARDAVAGSQNLVCPNSSYSFTSVEPGDYLLRVQLPINDVVAAGFPWRVYSTTQVEVAEAPVARDLPVEPGLPLGGGVFVDGVGIPGISLILFHADVPIFGVSQGASGPDGGWDEFFERTPMVLQSGVRMVPSVFCELLGARLLTPQSFEPFVFPDQASAITCNLTQSDAVKYSHDRTRLVVTPGPGDIGVTSSNVLPDGGLGWGVQFPVNPGERPQHRDITGSQLFMGGLIIGIRPDRILSGLELNGYILPCDCRAFGPEGKLRYTASPAYGKKVTWQYSDAGFSHGAGLKVVQKSYDGVPPADYVLFRFTLTNSGVAPLTIYPGMFADWDIDDDFLDDVGATEGRLMYMTNADGGVAGGSLIISDAPVAGTSFGTLNPGDVRTPEGTVSELAGDVTNPSAPDPGDHNYVQSIGPITLAVGGSTQFWIAIVAGESLDQLRSNAAAATADVAARRGQPDVSDDVAATTVIASPQASTSKAHRAISPTCKRGCGALE